MIQFNFAVKMIGHKRNTSFPDSHPENPAKRPKVENNSNHNPLVDNQPQYTDIPLCGNRSYDNTSLDLDLDSMVDDPEGLFTEVEQPIILAPAEQQIGQETPGTQQTLDEGTYRYFGPAICDIEWGKLLTSISAEEQIDQPTETRNYQQQAQETLNTRLSDSLIGQEEPETNTRRLNSAGRRVRGGGRRVYFAFACNRCKVSPTASVPSFYFPFL